MSFYFDILRKNLITFSQGNNERLAACMTVHSIKKIFLERYKHLIPIENLSVEEKKDWWEETKKLIPGRSKQEMIEGCKVLYTIGNLL